MAILVLDPTHEAIVRKLWPGLDDESTTEVWEGMTVVAPIPNDEHQDIASGLNTVFYLVVQDTSLGVTRPGVNLSDRTPEWRTNYRNPDVVVFLDGSSAVNYGSHWVGGPDFVVEIVSPGEKPKAKFAFYESVGTREVLVVHRDPWKLELFALDGESLRLVESSELTTASVCPSAALGLTFRLTPGRPRPRIAVTHPVTGRTWSV